MWGCPVEGRGVDNTNIGAQTKQGRTETGVGKDMNCVIHVKIGSTVKPLYCGQPWDSCKCPDPCSIKTIINNLSIADTLGTGASKEVSLFQGVIWHIFV